MNSLYQLVSITKIPESCSKNQISLFSFIQQELKVVKKVFGPLVAQFVELCKALFYQYICTLILYHYQIIIKFHMQGRDDQFQNDQEQTCYESVLNCCGSLSGALRAWLPCCCCWCPYPYKQVHQAHIGLKERFGRYLESLPAGLHQINPCTETIIEINLKTFVMDLERQLVLTKDNIMVSIDTCVYYRIIDAKLAFYTLANIQASVSEITYATLRTFCGENTLQELLVNRQEISDKIQQYVYSKVNKWGIYVEQIFIKDMTMDQNLQRSLSMTSKTERLSKAKIISASADVESAKLMHQAADILNSKAAMQIRYLEVLQTISNGGGPKMLFMPLSNNEFE